MAWSWGRIRVLRVDCPRRQREQKGHQRRSGESDASNQADSETAVIGAR